MTCFLRGLVCHFEGRPSDQVELMYPRVQSVDKMASIATLFHHQEDLARKESSRLFTCYPRLEPKLLKYAKNMEWGKIERRCLKYPKKAAREAQFDEKSHETALHVVLRPFCLLENQDLVLEDLIESRHRAAAALVEANPEAALASCVLGLAPIHLVAMDPCAHWKDLDMLLASCPSSTRLFDLQKRTALHYVCMTNRSNLTMMKQLLTVGPEAAAVSDTFGRLPLHYACMANPMIANNKSTHQMLRFHQAIAQVSGNSPLCTQQILQLVLEAHPSATGVPDSEGRTPLHHFCNYLETQLEQKTVTPNMIHLVCLLVQTNRQVVALPDQDGLTPLTTIHKLQQQSRARKSLRSLHRPAAAQEHRVDLLDAAAYTKFSPSRRT